ncbi:Uncharacterised protein [Escherichia coli]|nr:Uncharacterised protein [Escherichia coli]
MFPSIVKNWPQPSRKRGVFRRSGWKCSPSDSISGVRGLRRGWVTVHGRSAPERSLRRIYTGRSAMRGWTYHQPAIFPACAMPFRSVKRLCWFHVTIYRNFSYRTLPIKTAPSIASGQRRAGYAQHRVTALIMTVSVMTSWRMQRISISGWWVSIHGTPRT